MKLAAAILIGVVHCSALAPSASFTMPRRVRVATTRCRAAFEDDFIRQQKIVSDEGAEAAAASSPAREHLRRQRECFDEMADFFDADEATPPEVVPLLEDLARRAVADAAQGGNRRPRLLDVGCGTGALFPFYLAAADDLGIGLDIVGLDLSPRMSGFAAARGRRLAAERDGAHAVACETGDFVQTVLGIERCGATLTGFEDGVVDDGTREYRGAFDAVVVNACVSRGARGCRQGEVTPAWR